MTVASMDWRTTYKQKLLTMEQAVALIQSGDTVTAGISTNLPYKFMDALAGYALGHLENVKFYMGAGFKPYKLGMPQLNGKIDVISSFYGPIERAFVGAGSHFPYQPIHLSDTLEDRREKHRAKFLVLAGTAPDENGMVSIGPSPMDIKLLDCCDAVILQVNENMPFVYGEDCIYPMDRIDYLVEGTESLPVLPPAPPSPEETAIAGYIVDLIPDGACIQLGIGGVASAIGRFLKAKKDLGIHTEMFVEPMVELMKCGAVNNSKKNFCPGKSVLGFALGTPEMYQFMDRNPAIEGRPFAWVNDPRVIAQNDNMMSINGAMQIDLTGQVCAESVGPMQYSGTGGQADFVRGAKWSKGGKSFLALPSTRTTKDGELKSKISLTLPAGSVITTPRSDVQYVVTEYGIADLRYEPVDVRARRLIAIAHPDFREELTFQAKQAGLII